MTRARISALVFVVAVSLSLVACGAGGTSIPFHFENATNEEITIRVNDRLRLLIPPGESKSFNTPNNKTARRVIAVDASGDTRMDRVYQWDELEAVNFSIKIE